MANSERLICVDTMYTLSSQTRFWLCWYKCTWCGGNSTRKFRL